MGPEVPRTLAETVSVAKTPFEIWYRNQAVSIPIQILDPELKAQIIKDHPNVRWIGAGNRSGA
jgi:hypothetical protein